MQVVPLYLIQLESRLDIPAEALPPLLIFTFIFELLFDVIILEPLELGLLLIMTMPPELEEDEAGEQRPAFRLKPGMQLTQIPVCKL
jgi:hypothetical protein